MVSYNVKNSDHNNQMVSYSENVNVKQRSQINGLIK